MGFGTWEGRIDFDPRVLGHNGRKTKKLLTAETDAEATYEVPQ